MRSRTIGPWEGLGSAVVIRAFLSPGADAAYSFQAVQASGRPEAQGS